MSSPAQVFSNSIPCYFGHFSSPGSLFVADTKLLLQCNHTTRIMAAKSLIYLALYWERWQRYKHFGHKTWRAKTTLKIRK
jgi:hypothetical protein